MLRRARWNIIIPIMVIVFFGAMFIVNKFYTEFPEDERLTMYIWASLISGVASLIMFPSKEQEKLIEEGHAKQKKKRQERLAKKQQQQGEKPKYPFKK